MEWLIYLSTEKNSTRGGKTLPKTIIFLLSHMKISPRVLLTLCEGIWYQWSPYNKEPIMEQPFPCHNCNNMPVMLIRVIRDCNVRSDFYDVNRVLFKDGRVLSRFLIMVAAVQWYFSPHTNPWTPKVGWMQDKLFIYLFDLRLVRDAEIFAPKPSRFHQSRCMGRLETAFRAVQDSH